jgi:hypothetical protein
MNIIMNVIGFMFFCIGIFSYFSGMERSFENSRHKYEFISFAEEYGTKIDTLKKLKYNKIDATPFDVYDTDYLTVTLHLNMNNNILIPQSVTITDLEGKLITEPVYRINNVDSGTQWVIKYPQGTLNNVVLGITSYYMSIKTNSKSATIIQDSILININEKISTSCE